MWGSHQIVKSHGSYENIPEKNQIIQVDGQVSLNRLAKTRRKNKFKRVVYIQKESRELGLRQWKFQVVVYDGYERVARNPYLQKLSPREAAKIRRNPVCDFPTDPLYDLLDTHHPALVHMGAPGFPHNVPGHHKKKPYPPKHPAGDFGGGDTKDEHGGSKVERIP